MSASKTDGTAVVDRDPRQQGPQPPYPEQSQPFPGLEARMQPRPDFGKASYRGSGKLIGKKALITGADSGIGRAVALAFAREGADVLISYLDEDADARETARAVQESGRTAITVPGDIGDEAHCRRLVERAVEEFGRLDILVNNAAYQHPRDSVTQVTEDDLERTFRTNLFAMFFLCKAAVPRMQAGASIINTSSIQAFQPSPKLLAYATSKAAIVAFTKGLAQEVIARGIRVNCVAPGPVWTPLIPATSSPQAVATFGQQAPIGRPAQPAELAPAYVYLASDDAGYVSGQVLGVTGGSPLI